MSDLMEQIEVMEEPEPLSQAKRFIELDLNAPEAEAPENARFESDRNTSAASELAPNQDLPQEDLPTTQGDSPLPYFKLQNRDYTDGEFDQPPSSTGAAEAASNPVGVLLPPTPEVTMTDAAPGEEADEGESDELVEGVDTLPENMVGETLTRPEESLTDGEAETSTMLNSFTDPTSSSITPAFGELGAEDQFAAAMPEPVEEAEIGELADPAQAKEKRAGGTGVDFENSEPVETPKVTGVPEMNDADVGLFAEGFSPHELQNTTNGTLTNIGQNAVDAEGTAAGAYKRKVKQEISRMWHRYRVQHGDFVTYGILKLECRVDRYGKVHDLKVVENDTNTVLAEFSLKAILDANLPAMSDEVAKELGPSGLQLQYDIIIY
ncbi:MAG: hypothetical protein AAF357_13595, partial [Verrucomicrobiota bacterium]